MKHLPRKPSEQLGFDSLIAEADTANSVRRLEQATA
jgi:hypothetical protein